MGKILAEKSYELIKSLKNEDYLDEVKFEAHLRKFDVPMKDFTKYRSKVCFANRLKFLFKKHFTQEVISVSGIWKIRSNIVFYLHNPDI